MLGNINGYLCQEDLATLPQQGTCARQRFQGVHSKRAQDLRTKHNSARQQDCSQSLLEGNAPDEPAVWAIQAKKKPPGLDLETDQQRGTDLQSLVKWLDH
ncbi:MAG: hypothetical protein FRX49_13179 [Trebouxia sp. A1-2]|nr:MAG: hypothetical protein FRX49_13179 [Trebouxia sp. A1-2]